MYQKWGIQTLALLLLHTAGTENKNDVNRNRYKTFQMSGQ